MAGNGLFMGLGGIPFVAVEPEFGVAVMKVGHDPVSGYFGNDRGRSNGNAQRVALGNGLLFDCSRRGKCTVNKKEIGCRAEFPGRLRHGEQRGLEDIDFIDLEIIDEADTHRYGTFPDLVIKLISFAGRQLFRIIDPGGLKSSRKNDGPGNNRAGQGTPTGLIYTGDLGEALQAGFIFEFPEVNYQKVIPKIGFWIKIKAAAKFKPEEHIGYFEDLN